MSEETEDAILNLLQKIDANLDNTEREAQQNKLTFLGDIDIIVGIFANYFQFLGVPGIGPVISGLIGQHEQERSPLETRILQDISAKVDDLVNLAGATSAEVRMTSLFSWSNPVHSDLETVTHEGQHGQHVDPVAFHGHALEFVDACLDDGYWYRPLVVTRAFTPANMGGTIGLAWYGPFSSVDPPYRLLPPTDTSQIEGFTTVLDPQLLLPSFLTAINNFLEMEQKLDPDRFGDFLATWNDKVREIADAVQCLYDGSVVRKGNISCGSTLLGGLRKSDVPGIDEVFDYVFVNSHPGTKRGFEWNGIIGVVDVYGVFPNQVSAPAAALSHVIDLFPTEHIEAVADEPRDSFTFKVLIYLWVIDRIRVGLMARWKALYFARGYDKVWSLLEHLHVLTGQQSHELRDPNKDWSLGELFKVLSGLPADGDRFGFKVSILVDRLDQIGSATWDHLPAEPLPSYLDVPRLQRPISLRGRLTAAAGV